MLICAVWSGGDRRTGPCIIVCMAKKLGIHTLAEGVETSAQVRFLRSIGCEKIQGIITEGSCRTRKFNSITGRITP